MHTVQSVSQPSFPMTEAVHSMWIHAYCGTKSIFFWSPCHWNFTKYL